MIETLCKGLKEMYGEISRCDGPILNHLGMVFNLSHKGEAKVTMQGYVEDMMVSSDTPNGASTPGIENIFNVHDGVPRATDEEQARFHTIVAKLLYLAKRARPDCLTAVAFLATRVTRCDHVDLEKLERLVKYVRATKEHGLVLHIGKMGV